LQWGKIKTNKQKVIATILIVILIAFIPLGAAAPVGTSEAATVKAAKNWIGVKTLYKGNSRSGIDCSHLVYQVYKQVGAKSIAFQTVPNMKNNKYYVTTTSPKPGDVIFWKKNAIKNGKRYSLVNHVGIYIGSGQFIHTSDETGKVAIDSVSGMYKNGTPYYARWSHT
jgi:cell wall-associated NlpC family hydrolase